MFWSEYETFLLITGILSLLLAVLPLPSTTSRERIIGGVAGVAFTIAAFALANVPVLTYPWFIFLMPLVPLGFIVWNVIVSKVAADMDDDEPTESWPVSTAAAALGAPASSGPAAQQVTRAAVTVAHTPYADLPVGLGAGDRGLLSLATDPETSLGTLAELAYRHPSLRPAIAANPATYPDLLSWLAQFGDPAINQALANRVS